MMWKIGTAAAVEKLALAAASKCCLFCCWANARLTCNKQQQQTGKRTNFSTFWCFDDGEDIFEEVFNDGEDIFEEVFDDGEDIFEKVFDDGEDIFEEVFDDGKDTLDDFALK